MTVAELIELLKKHPQDAHVAHTFDSIVFAIEPDMVFVSKDGVVLIGDDYREEFQSGELSAAGHFGEGS